MPAQDPRTKFVLSSCWSPGFFKNSLGFGVTRDDFGVEKGTFPCFLEETILHVSASYMVFVHPGKIPAHSRWMQDQTSTWQRSRLKHRESRSARARGAARVHLYLFSRT